MKLSRINTLLLVAIILVNGYVIVTPFMPAISFWWQQRSGSKQTALTEKLHAPTSPAATGTKPAPTSVPQDNRLIIPSMLLDTGFFAGPDARTLNKGPWLRPQGSTPDKGGNTVIAAHRFTYSDREGDFYHLDKVRPGDEVGLFWKGVKYLYSVQAVKVVGPDAVEIEAPTDQPQLTLYTCTPLWLPKDRLVIIATPQEGYAP